MATLTYQEFTEACLEFLSISQKIGDCWKASGDTYIDGNFFLSKKACVSTVQTKASADVLMLGEEITDEHLDPSSLGSNCVNIIVSEYHIVFSLSHSVPVLYFNVFDASGNLLTLEEIMDRVPALYSEQIIFNKWQSLTQQEHPVLGRPFFQLHPCKTSSVMSHLLSGINDLTNLKGWRYIASWLSMFAPVVGLHIPLSYFSDV
ncbi:E2-like conjugating enzyme atg10 [Halocaridina rubra]|uniref:Ubiquitin-like-conjugating enzyme ATG10 n=1 Tax=Halocaridina rubra TaxID=373956 RepID=A0AAN8WYZ7_HALRR